MNDARRQELSKACAFIKQAQGIIQAVRTEEELDIRAETGDKKLPFREAVYDLIEADDFCDMAVSNIDSARE